MNVLLEPWDTRFGLPPFAQVKDEDFGPAFDVALDRARANIRAIADGPAADFAGVIEALELDGVLQVASFHPDYRFADSLPDDIENHSNRSPFPTLHLLREDSIDRAVDAYPDPDAIVERNYATLRRLGHAGQSIV